MMILDVLDVSNMLWPLLLGKSIFCKSIYFLLLFFSLCWLFYLDIFYRKHMKYVKHGLSCNYNFSSRCKICSRCIWYVVGSANCSFFFLWGGYFQIWGLCIGNWTAKLVFPSFNGHARWVGFFALCWLVAKSRWFTTQVFVGVSSFVFMGVSLSASCIWKIL